MENLIKTISLFIKKLFNDAFFALLLQLKRKKKIRGIHLTMENSSSLFKNSSVIRTILFLKINYKHFY